MIKVYAAAVIAVLLALDGAINHWYGVAGALVLAGGLLNLVPDQLFIGRKEATLLRVNDADGIVVIMNGVRMNIRLGGWIDADESYQPFGPRALRYLESLAQPGETLTLKFTAHHPARGSYKERWVAFVYNSRGQDLSYEMVKAGYAWATRKSPREYRIAGQEAENNRLGLWIQDNPQPPWEARQQH